MLAPLCSRAQYYEVPTDQILQNANLVVHGEVMASTSIMQDETIYTENILKIDQVLTGDNKVNEVIILTRGGTMDGVTQFQSHGFSLRKGDKGFFFLKEKQSSWGESYHEVYAGQQGFYQKRHDGFMTSLYSQMKSYPSLNSFYKNFGFNYDEVKLEEEMRAVNNPNACLRYRLEPIETENINASNQIAFNMYVRSTEPVSLRELSIQLNYSNNWFGQNIVANNKLNLSDGDFPESYVLQSSDISEDILEVSLRSTAPIDQLQLLSGSEIKLATVSISFDESASELPIIVENTIYRSLYYDEDGNLVRNSCGHIEIGEGGCGPIITGIDIRKAAGDQSILTITGAGFIHSSVDPSGNDEWCGLPNMEHRVKFKTVDLGVTISPLEHDYISWSNDEIRLKVPSVGYIDNSFNLSNPNLDEVAGTFNITVCIDDNEFQKCACYDQSGINDNPNDGELYVPFSTFTRPQIAKPDPSVSECNFSEHARLITPFLNEVRFFIGDLTQDQQSAFERALDTWVCKVGIDFEIAPFPWAGTVPVTFAALPSGVLGGTALDNPNCGIDDLDALVTLAMQFNSDSNINWKFDNNTPIGPSEFDFESAVLHELGHAMGLLHTCNEDNVMYPQAIEGDASKRVLTQDDIDGGAYCKGRSTIEIEGETWCRELQTGFCDGSTGTIKAENSITSTITIYPNPTVDKIKITLTDTTLFDYNVKIYDTNSALVYHKNILRDEAILNLENFKTGVYFIMVEVDGIIVGSEKVVKL